MYHHWRRINEFSGHCLIPLDPWLKYLTLGKLPILAKLIFYSSLYNKSFLLLSTASCCTLRLEPDPLPWPPSSLVERRDVRLEVVWPTLLWLQLLLELPLLRLTFYLIVYILHNFFSPAA